jgi:flagellar hook-basal body complex protein FliE
MVINVADAVAAYRQGGNSAGSQAGGAATDAGAGSFSDALKQFAGDAVDSIKKGEAAATAGATGKADIASVVTAINEAQLMLQTVVTIRDKVIAAYQSITQTSI